MLILALDSTALVGSVALCDNEHLLAECTLNTGNTHSETLLPTVEFVLKSCGVTQFRLPMIERINAIVSICVTSIHFCGCP